MHPLPKAQVDETCTWPDHMYASRVNIKLTTGPKYSLATPSSLFLISKKTTSLSTCSGQNGCRSWIDYCNWREGGHPLSAPELFTLQVHFFPGSCCFLSVCNSHPQVSRTATLLATKQGPCILIYRRALSLSESLTLL